MTMRAKTITGTRSRRFAAWFGGAAGAAALLAGMLSPVSPSAAAPPPRLGYWKLAGVAEFWDSKLPPRGSAKHAHSGGWVSVYEVADGKVRFTNTLPNNPKVLVIGEVTWAQPPAAIYPGEVIGVSGTARLAEFRNGGLGFGAEVGLMCQIGIKGQRPGQDPGLGAAAMLLGFDRAGTLRARSHGIGGRPAQKLVEYRNTDGVYGQKGMLFSNSGQEVYLLYTVGGAGYSPRVAYRYVWAAGEEQGKRR